MSLSFKLPQIKLKPLLPYLLLFLIFFVNVCLFWPGQMNPDSICQYKCLSTGVYIDHHPPIMSIFWKILDFFYKGPGLLFLFHMLLLYGSSAIFITIFHATRFRWFYLFFPLIPPISIYSSMIWKDAGFTFSYLFSGALLSYFIANKKVPNIFVSIAILLLLFYGTGVKFQALYILPVMLFGFCYVVNQFKINKKTFFSSLFIYVIFFCSLKLFDNYFVPAKNKWHSWQLVKLYDLTAISLDKNKILFPAFIQQNPNFSIESIKKKFNYERVDDLVWGESPPLITGKNEKERQQIFDLWMTSVLHNPMSYLKHRFYLWFTMLNNYPIKKLATLDFEKYDGLKWFVKLKQSTNDSPTLSSKIKYYVGKIMIGTISLLRYPLKSIFLLPIILFYLFLGLFLLGKTKFAMPLVLFNGSGILLLFILFFFSMASPIRYVYFTICMFHASHGFTYAYFKSKARKDHSST